jgi:hypothetical protein
MADQPHGFDGATTAGTDYAACAGDTFCGKATANKTRINDKTIVRFTYFAPSFCLMVD